MPPPAVCQELRSEQEQAGSAALAAARWRCRGGARGEPQHRRVSCGCLQSIIDCSHDMQPPVLLLRDCRVLDTVAGECPDVLYHVVLSGGRILSVWTADDDEGAASAAAVAAVAADLAGNPPQVLACGGRVLMPGLCDAHVHVTACTANLPGLLALSESLVAARAGRVLEGMLM